MARSRAVRKTTGRSSDEGRRDASEQRSEARVRQARHDVAG